MVDKLNEFQREFLEALSDIQESCVQTALEQDDDELLKGKYYEITSDVIIRIMEIIDGYCNQNIGKLKVTCIMLMSVLQIIMRAWNLYFGLY